MPSPLTKLAHKWVAIEITPIDVYRRQDGEIMAMRDPDAETEIQMGCNRCDASPEEGWHTVCQAADDEA